MLKKILPLAMLVSGGMFLFTAFGQNAGALANTTSCSRHIRSGSRLGWATYINGSPFNNGVLIIHRVEGGKWFGIQIRSNGHQENASGEIYGSNFTQYNPRWRETWHGLCSPEAVGGVIDVPSDNRSIVFALW
jgi:hypothetical protein